jgi:hypothetical protein
MRAAFTAFGAGTGTARDAGLQERRRVTDRSESPMRKSARLRGLAVAAGLAAAGIATAPGTAYATATDSKMISANQIPNAFSVSFWKVGDCHFQGRVTLEADRVHLHATSLTEHTNHADVWHSTFVFFDVNGRAFLVAGNGGDNTGPFDSPQMVPQGGASSGPSAVYTWDREYILPPGSHPVNAYQVRWNSAC